MGGESGWLASRVCPVHGAFFPPVHAPEHALELAREARAPVEPVVVDVHMHDEEEEVELGERGGAAAHGQQLAHLATDKRAVVSGGALRGAEGAEGGGGGLARTPWSSSTMWSKEART